jgi:hypothetical protein
MLNDVNAEVYLSDSGNPLLGAGFSLLLVQTSIGDAILAS